MSVLFKDSDGREWLVKVTVSAVDRVLDLCGIDLYKSEDWGRVLEDPRIACAVLAAVLQPVFAARNITPEQFRDALDGDAAAAGIEALHEAIANFTPPELRATRVAMVQKIREATRIQAEAEKARMDSGIIDRLMAAAIRDENKRIDQRINDQLGKLSGATPGDSMSIQEN